MDDQAAAIQRVTLTAGPPMGEHRVGTPAGAFGRNSVQAFAELSRRISESSRKGSYGEVM